MNVVRELFGVMAAERAKGGFIVISGRFTEDAKVFAQGKNLRLIEGAELNEMIRQSRAAVARQNSQATISKAPYQPTSVTPDPLAQPLAEHNPSALPVMRRWFSAWRNEEAMSGIRFGVVRSTPNAKPHETRCQRSGAFGSTHVSLIRPRLARFAPIEDLEGRVEKASPFSTLRSGELASQLTQPTRHSHHPLPHRPNRRVIPTALRYTR